MTALIDLAGRDIAGWHVLARADNSRHGMARWWCRCLSCGVVVRVHGGNLRAGTSRRCVGCRGRLQRRQRHPVGSAAQ